MSRHRKFHAPHAYAVLTCLVIAFTSPCWAIPRTWIGGNATWSDGTGNGNWDPSGEPGLGDDVTFNSANTVTMGTSNSVQMLTMSGSFSLNTGGFNLTSNGTVTLSNASLVISGSTSRVTAYRLNINSGATVNIAGGSITIDRDAGSGNLDLNLGGTLSGTGTISLLDATTGGPVALFSNDGTLSVRSEPLIPFTAPPVGMLLITAPSANARIDLDGGNTDGVANVFQNQTLKIVPAINDPFGSQINLFHNATFESVQPWSMNVGSIDVATGAIPESLPNPAIGADIAYIAGGTFTQTGGTIRVIDSDGALQFNAPFVQSGGTLAVNGKAIINSNSRIESGAVVNGGGSMTITSSGTLLANHGVSLGVRVRNDGAFSPAGNSSVGLVSMNQFEQTGTGRLYMQLSSTTVGDRLDIDGSAAFGGELHVGRVDPVMPVPGSILTTIEYLSYSGGTFNIINDTGLAGLSFIGTYNSTSFSLISVALVSGDADLNGRVDARDLVALANHWLGSANWLGGDFTGDGLVNQADLTVLAQNWQAGVLAPSFMEAATDLGLPGSSVPEPSAMFFIAIGLLGLPSRRRRYNPKAPWVSTS